MKVEEKVVSISSSLGSRITVATYNRKKKKTALNLIHFLPNLKKNRKN